jgi:glycosyltransferase involved in cell wall biosynthesis
MKVGPMEPRKPLKVLYIDTGIGLAGGQFGLIELLRNLDRARVEPVVASPPGSGLEAFCKGSQVCWVGFPLASDHVSRDSGRVSRLAVGFCESWCALRLLARTVRNFDIDIIHANTFKAGLVAGLAGKLSRTPLIFHDRTLFGHPPLGFLLWSLTARIIVISKAVMAKYPRRYVSKIRHIPDMVDVARFRPLPGDARGESQVIGYLGRISEEKGLIHLVRAAPLVLQKCPTARFSVGGVPLTAKGERYLAAVRREIEALGLHERFDLLGRVEDAPGFLRGVSLLVLPSESEGSGTVVLEAMAMQRPIVAFDSGGQRELITDGGDGYLVSSLSARALADAIVRVLDDPGAAARMGAKGREKVVVGYASAAVTADIMRIYAEVAG